MHFHRSPAWQPVRLVQHDLIMKVVDAVKELTSTYRSLGEVARGLPVDADEVAKALAKASPDSEEATALRVLASFNPVVKPTAKVQVEIKD